MAITLGEILQWDILEKARIITTSFHPDTLVENITIMEAPDIGRWIDGSNIVLTGLYSIYEDKRKIAEFIDSLCSGRICALFVKIHRFVEEVPPVIIETCKKHRIAVVEIPGHIRYIDIMYPVIAAIFDSQVVQLSYYKQTLNALTGPALNNKGTRSIVRAFSGIVNNPVALYDNNMNCLCATNDAFARWQQQALLEEGEWENLEYSIFQTLFEGQSGPLRQFLVPLRVFGQTKAYLSIVEQNKKMEELDFIATENAVTVLSFELVKDFAEEEVEGRFKTDMAEDIRLGRNMDTLKDRLAGIRLSAEAHYNVYMIEMPENPISRTPAIVKQKLVNQQADKAYSLFMAAKNKLRLRGFESQQGNLITAIIEQPGASRLVCEKTLENLSEEILQRAAHAFSNSPLHIGYTSEFREIAQTTQLYKNAQDGLHISRLLYGENSFCDYEKLGVYKILCLVRERRELENYIPTSIKALQQYQATSGLPLVETLVSYFENNGNVQQTAKALFVHYKTLHYRLNKIQTVAEVDLKNSMQTFEMQMGLAILRLLEK